MINPLSAWIVGRAVIDTVLIVLWGALGSLAVAAPRPLSDVIGRQLSGLSLCSIALLALAVPAVLAAQVAILADGWRGMLDPQIVRSFLLVTGPGHAWLALAAGVFLLGLARFLAAERRGLMALFAGLSLASLALTGHAVMNTGPISALHAGFDVLHVLSAGAWLGGLVAFVGVMRAAGEADCRSLAVIALRRLSTFGHVAVALVLLSGVANTLLVVGHLPLDLRSPYQVKLLVKIGLVALMTLAAVFNRYVLVPLLQRDRARAVRALKAGAVFEIALGIIAVVLVAAFGTQDPA
ncbi:copper homeostasis membrane protein CopD [Brucella anthropi]|uniref:copper homeostasis membrane protein CopD n=1 Tax=Brucella anthropi TaxID=529 RepID=UPI0007750528|nr:copper homeostasis membrane protein CopD [Brucella anthropi]KXO72931.1 hypothetical protein AYJ56_17205 [Brucella anthropi]